VSSLATIIEKNQDKLVDQAATSIKVMYSFAFADVPQDELKERLYGLFDSLVEITRKGAVDPNLVEEIAESVMVGPLYEGFDNNSITEEVLQVVDMVTTKMIDSKLAKAEEAEDKQASRELLASTIRSAKDIVNRQQRRSLEQKQLKQAKKQRS
jgi:hypothetical protein